MAMTVSIVPEARPAEKTTATGLAPGLSVTRHRRRSPELDMLLIDGTLTNDGGKTARASGVSLGDWTLPAAGDRDDTRYGALAYRNDHWYGSTYWAGPDWTRVGRDWHHPGINTTAVRRFTAPRDGRVAITGRVYKAHLDGDGIVATIRHGRRALWTAELEGKDAKGREPALKIDVRKGDAIRFIVHKRGRIFCDTTRWDPAVTYEDGEKFQASVAFSTKQQGEHGWSYEMEVDPKATKDLPRVYAFTPDLAVRSEILNAGTPLELSNRDVLPLLVVAGRGNDGGIVLALNSAGPWRLKATLGDGGPLHVTASAGDEKTPLVLKPGESVRLPRVAMAEYRGRWQVGITKIQRLLDPKSGDSGMDAFRKCFAAAKYTDLNLVTMVHADWRQQDKLTETVESYTAAVRRHVEKARLLLADLREGRTHDFLAAEARQLEQLSAEARRPGLDLEDWRSLYRRVRWLKREIALANPLMDFGKLLFCKRVPTSYSHLVMQYYGWRARAGGGLFVLEAPGRSLRCRDITGGRLDDGCVLEPCLSYDGKRIVFSYVECKGKSYNPAHVTNTSDGGYYHVWEVHADGTGLRQLTDGPYDDLMPAYLPDGGIALSSTRRRGYARCFGGQFSARWDIYTLHRIDGDGRNIRMLSCYDTNEWFPAVANDGRIVFARWDYIDRDAVTHQNLWATRPDGTNPTTVWGNATASPHCSFQAKPIPGSDKFVFTASAHHSITGGSIAIVDPSVDFDGHRAITRITPEIPFPEAESRNIREYYTSPWPLSEKYFLVGYSAMPLVWEPGANPPGALGIYLLDKFGNRELIYRDPAIGSTNPIPLVSRPAPPVIPSDLPTEAPPAGEMSLADVYQGLGKIPRGSIKRLRIVQIFPKTTPIANRPAVGLAGEENGRAILGTVPVEPDGSARFTVPALKPILFQALDENGFAYQTMRSATYVQPGEKVSCVGCHENRLTAPVSARPMAMQRPPSKIEPGRLGGRPFSYVEMVQPVWDKHCVACHAPGKKQSGGIDLTGTPLRGFSQSYWSLCGRDNFNGGGTNPQNAAKALVPRFGARNQVQVTLPGGMYGARGSRLMKLLRDGHENVKLSADELRRVAAWIDCNAIFYGVNLPEDQARQLRGEPVPMPAIQ